MTEKVSFAREGGIETGGEIALPAGEARAGAVVLIHEWWGLNDHVRSLLGRLAGAGFVALAPDLFAGKVTRDAGEAAKLMQGLDWGSALEDIAGAARYLAGHPRSNGKVGVLGFCMGGALSFAAAASVKGLSAVVPFYGLPSQKLDFDAVEAPILAHFAARDEWAKPELAEDIKRELEARGKSIELHVYDAQHAFVNDTRPEVHDPDAAKIAWDRSVAFLRQHLGG